jgi:DNA-directed RNA polymerase specialized sigma24 family protein
LYADTAARLHEVAHEEYDMEQDLTVESIQGIIEDMLSDTVEQWFRATLFNMWLQESNYSELARLTGIPRTSISQAVQECKAYIKKRIDNGTHY